ncbi:MAG: NADH-quinone oxidoreductase subunit J [Acidobacteria bacterium]|nr:NADH-quinone oxidoreductase subunit J [Acidobacteriota bacterium]MCI0628154.1 NADH-quinone oxidoreductase subunit J [Acidobacteriota bacterium]
MEIAIFLLFASVAIVSAANILIQRHPIYSALSLIVTFAALAGIYMQMHAEFIAVMQIVIYTGAIMVLFIFVIMLLNAREEQRVPDKVHVVKYFGIPLAVLLIVEAGLIVSRPFSMEGIPVASASINLSGNTQLIGKALYTQYALPFEITSILLLVAIVGAIVMAKKEL